jgi:hypothetical protein
MDSCVELCDIEDGGTVRLVKALDGGHPRRSKRLEMWRRDRLWECIHEISGEVTLGGTVVVALGPQRVCCWTGGFVGDDGLQGRRIGRIERRED